MPLVTPIISESSASATTSWLTRLHWNWTWRCSWSCEAGWFPSASQSTSCTQRSRWWCLCRWDLVARSQNTFCLPPGERRKVHFQSRRINALVISAPGRLGCLWWQGRTCHPAYPSSMLSSTSLGQTLAVCLLPHLYPIGGVTNGWRPTRREWINPLSLLSPWSATFFSMTRVLWFRMWWAQIHTSDNGDSK